MKIVSPEASHKTEVGGVALGLRDAAAVRAAAEAMTARLAAHDPRARVEGFLVQEMVDGLEMILGVREDPQFGPFMLVGLGGVHGRGHEGCRDPPAAGRRGRPRAT